MNAQAIRAPLAITQLALTDVAGMAAVDAFVLARPDGTIFQRPAWLQAITRGCGQSGFFLAAHDRAGALAGIVPVTRMHSHLFGRALVSSGFGVGGGILADAPVACTLKDNLEKHARKGNYPSVELRGGCNPGSSWHPVRDTYANFLRPLAKSDEAEMLAIPRKQRAEVRKACAFALDIEVGRGRRDRDAHYAVYSESVRNLGSPVFPRRLFSAMLDAFPDAEILTVRRQGKPLASVLSLRHAGAIMPYWGGGIAEARVWRANDSMYWALMRHARETGSTRFDFGRSKVGSGAYAYKRNWGFAPEPLIYWTHGQSRSLNPNDERYMRKIALWKKLPLPIANLIGPVLARGLG